jgi:protein-tyrosine phosphatase
MSQELTKLNFRDLGGLPSGDGAAVRHGVIFRSEGPASFHEVHERELRALGIRLICDLRAESERLKSPNEWAPDARLLNIDINSDVRVGPKDLMAKLGEDRSVAALKQMSRTNYSQTARALQPRLRELIQALVDGEWPVLIHCTAGKDRTGVLVALLLEALDVPEEVVIADYLRSDVYAQNLRNQDGLRAQIGDVFGFEPGDDWINVLIGVDEEFIRSALETVHAEWGTVPAYLAAGVDDDLLARFRRLMIVPT